MYKMFELHCIPFCTIACDNMIACYNNPTNGLLVNGAELHRNTYYVLHLKSNYAQRLGNQLPMQRIITHYGQLNATIMDGPQEDNVSARNVITGLLCFVVQWMPTTIDAEKATN